MLGAGQRKKMSVSAVFAGGNMIAGLALVLVATLGTRTHARNEVWASELAFWEDAASADGTWRAHMNYGRTLEAAGRRAEALVAFERAVELGPYAFAFINRGLAYIQRGRIDEGMADLHHALQLFPDSPDTHEYLAYGLEHSGAESAPWLFGG